MVDNIETEAAAQGYGPMAPCRRIENCSSSRIYCRKFFVYNLLNMPFSQFHEAHDHRDESGEVRGMKFITVPCESKFRLFCPIDRATCSYMLLLTSGEHTHPIPLPITLPPSHRATLLDCLLSFGPDLASATPRSIMRHPATSSLLRRLLPFSSKPVLGDWHPSLHNKDLLKAVISDAQIKIFPAGTGLDGKSSDFMCYKDYLTLINFRH